MNRRIYLDFDLENDLWRVDQLRSQLLGPAADQAGFFDPKEYEELLRQDTDALRQRIAERIAGTSVTLILIGTESASRPFVQLGIEESIAHQNGFVGIHIHAMDDELGAPSQSGPQPTLPAELAFPCYVWDWDLDRLQQEIEAAGRRADRQRARVSAARLAGGSSQP
jgi:hypothetical protein